MDECLFGLLFCIGGDLTLQLRAGDKKRDWFGPVVYS